MTMRNERPGDLPTLTEWDGRQLEWDGWERREVHLCPPEAAKCPCGYAGAPWMARALGHPRPGETTEGSTVRKSKRQPGRSFEIPKTVPAWPVWRVLAFRCVACRRTDLYEKGEGFDLKPIDPQPSLFELEDTP